MNINEIDPHEQHTWIVRWTYRDKSGVIQVRGGLWWLTEGSGSCDCNRLDHINGELTPELYPELFDIAGNMYDDGSGPIKETEAKCGDSIHYEIIGMTE